MSNNLKYSTTDLAVIIPTKDRPVELKRHLQSLVNQQCKFGRIIIIATGKDIKQVVMDFKNRLPVEHYTSKPGQIRQRNLGISKLDEKTKLVAAMDDDVIYHENAIVEMIHFWNRVENDTAGVGFNIINIPKMEHNWLRGLLGFSSKKYGQVLKSGFNTSISNISKNIQVKWLNGGSSVWRQNILQEYTMKEINTSWAVCEDLIFSYPLGKKFPLYVCSDSKVEIDEEIINQPTKAFYFYRGKAQYLWGLYFVMKNEDLSVSCFIVNKLLYCFAQLIKGTLYLDKTRIFIMVGIVKSFCISFKVLFGFQTVDEFKIEFIDSLN